MFKVLYLQCLVFRYKNINLLQLKSIQKPINSEASFIIGILVHMAGHGSYWATCVAFYAALIMLPQ